MSTTGRVIDNRIVEMQFDNRDFERNAQTTLGTLDKLKNSLNFNSAIAGLNDLAASVGEVNFSGLANSIDTVKSKFSAWEVIAFSALNKLTNQVIEFGEKFVKSMSIDQITAGWGKYESKIASVQTIMSATESTWKKNAEAIGFEGTQMEYVTAQLEKLNWFSDETSYSFTDMTNNIGKFTSSGVALSDAVTAMEGISVWAAKSGQNTQSASRAMYNLAQAISVGSVKLIDWKSIENANMATMEFKQTAIDTAVQLKYLKKVGDGLYKTTSGSTVSVENFNEALKDEWFSSEVLMETLNKYGKAATKLSEISEEYDVTATQFLSGLNKYNNADADLEDISLRLGISVEELVPLFDELNKEEYKLGLSAFKAAQEAKTLTEAIDATKDAVSTGWMKTFDLIFGNYEEAKVVWTELTERLWDVFAAGGEARNAVLQLWASGSGRDTLISSFWELWDVVDNFVSIIKEAFGEIFPHDIKSSAKKLLEFTDKLSEFVKGLWLSEESAAKLKTAFKGIFAFLDILGRSLQVITIPLKTIFDLLAGGSGTVLDFAESVGQWMINLRGFLITTAAFEHAGKRISNAILRIIDIVKYYQNMVGDSLAKGNSGIVTAFTVISDILSKVVGGIIHAFEELTGFDISRIIDDISSNLKDFYERFAEIAQGEVFQKIVDKLKGFISDVKGKVKEIGSIDISPVGEFFNKFYDAFDPINKIFAVIKFVFNGIVAFFTNLFPVLSAIGGKVFELLGDVGKALFDAFMNADFEQVYQIVKSGALAAISGSIVEFIHSLSDVTGGVGDIKDGIINVLDTAKESFKMWQNEIKSNILLKIGAAIAMITLSVIALSGVDSEKLTDAMSAITIEFIELVTAMNSLSKLDLLGLSKTGGVLIVISAAILLLTSSVKKLASLDNDALVRGIAGVAALALTLTKVAKSLSVDTGKIMAGTASLVLFAVAIRLLAKPVKELSELSWGDMLKGLLGVLVMVKGISLFLQETGDVGMTVATGVALIGMATGVLILSKALQNFATMDFVELVKGLSTFALVLYGMSEFMNSVSGLEKMVSAGVAMTIMGAAMMIFAKAIEMMGSLDIVSIGKGLAAMAISLYLVSEILWRMPKDSLKSAASLVVVALGINMLAKALGEMGKMPIVEIAKALGLLFLSLVTISIALNAMQNTMGAAASMVVMALAIDMLVPALAALGKLSLKEIAKSLLTLVGVFVILGVGSAFLSTMVPAMLAVAGAFALFGVAALALGAGLVMISAGIASFSVSVGTALGTIVLVIKALLDLLPDIGKAIVRTILETLTLFLQEAGGFISALIDFVVTVVESILDAIHRLAPRVVTFLREDLVRIVKALIYALKNLIPDIIDFVFTLLDQIVEVIKPLTTRIVNIALGIIDAIIENLPVILDKLLTFIVNLLNGLAKAIDDNSTVLKEAFINLFSSVIEAILEFLGFSDDKAKKFVDIGKKIIGSLVDGITSVISWVLEGFANIIEAIMLKFEEWIPDFEQIGKHIVEGIINGMAGMFDAAKGAANSIANSVKDGFAGNLKIKSPSRVFMQYGEYIDEGLIQGMKKLSGDVEDSGKDLGNSLIDEVGGPLQNLLAMIEDPEYSPVITPVLDLSTFDSQYSQISGLMNSSTIGMANYNQNALNANLSKKFEGGNIETSSPDVVGAINGLKQDVTSLGQLISNIYVRLDSGALVGQLTPAINETMGRVAVYRARGN